MAKRSKSAGVARVAAALVVLLALLAAAAPLAQAQEVNQPTPNIVGGQPVDQGEYPFLAALVDNRFANSYFGFFCGGSVISSRWVLTAAHCLFDDRGQQVEFPATLDIVVGRFDLDCNDFAGCSDGERITVSRIVVHPGYDPLDNSDNDLALIELASPTSVAPVGLVVPSQAALFGHGTPAVTIGWGSTNPIRENAEIPTVAHEVDVPIVADDICEGQYIAGAVVPSRMVCTGIPAGGIGPCSGDSGGPLLAFDGSGVLIQIGITSFGAADECALEFAPDVYTEVAAFQAFLKQEIGTCNGRLITIDMRHGASGQGTSGDDVIYGTAGADTIDGLGGDDTICGVGDNDTIFGGDGNDTLIGGAGNDVARGGPGADIINGGDGADRLLGGIDNDTMSGGQGDDYLGGFGGDDTINGDEGDDRIFGGFGSDVIDGESGDDTISGLVGDDTISGGDGNDVLNGDRGNDSISGGDGDDTIRGGNANDVLNGNDGNDNVAGGKGDDRLSGGNGTADICSGNDENVADFADNTCEKSFGVP